MNKPNKIDFNTIFDELDNLCLKLLKMNPVGRRYKTSPEKDISGIYLFSENGKPVYVGRSKTSTTAIKAILVQVLIQHPSLFYWHEIRQERTRQVINQTLKTRKELMKDDSFDKAFNETRKRIEKMEFRYVEESDSIRQALLVIYCAVKLNTEYNKFETH